MDVLSKKGNVFEQMIYYVEIGIVFYGFMFNFDFDVIGVSVIILKLIFDENEIKKRCEVFLKVFFRMFFLSQFGVKFFCFFLVGGIMEFIVVVMDYFFVVIFLIYDDYIEKIQRWLKVFKSFGEESFFVVVGEEKVLEEVLKEVIDYFYEKEVF